MEISCSWCWSSLRSGLRFAFFLFSCALVGWPGVVVAKEIGARTVQVTKSAETYWIGLAPGSTLTLSFLSPLRGIAYPDDWKGDLLMAQGAVTFVVPLGMPAEEIRTLVIVYASHYTLHIYLEPVTAKSGKVGRLLVDGGARESSMGQGSVPVAGQLVGPSAQPSRGQAVNPPESSVDGKESVNGMVMFEHSSDMPLVPDLPRTGSRGGEARSRSPMAEGRVVVRAIHQSHASRPVALGDCDDQSVFICGTHWGTVGDDGVLRFVIDNQLGRTIRVSRVSVFDEVTVADRAGAVFIDGQKTQGDGELLVEIPARARVEGSVLVRDPRSVGSVVRVMVAGPSQVVHAIQWIELQPPLERAWEEEKAFGVVGAAGAAWLSGGLGQGDRLDATTLRSFGVWSWYAVSKRLQIELGGLVAQTGTARFPDTEIDGVQGELTRRMRLVQALGGVVFRLEPDGTIPYVRFGIGSQIAVFRESFSAGEDPDSSLDFDLLWNAGFGVQRRLSDQVILGAALSISQEFDNETRYVHGGLHLGYTWLPPAP